MNTSMSMSRHPGAGRRALGAARTAALLVSVAGLAVVGGCKGSKRQQIVEAPAQVRPTQPVEPARMAVSGPIDRPSGKGMGKAELIGQQRLEAPARGPMMSDGGVIDAAPGQVQRIKYAARAADAEDFIRVMVGEFLGMTYVVEGGIRGAITVDIDAEMTISELEELFGAIAALQGWSVQRRGDALLIGDGKHVARAQTAPILRGEALRASDEAGIRVFRMRHITAAQSADAVREFISEHGRAVVVGRSLVAADRISQLNRLGKLLEALDSPAFDGVELWTYRLANQRPEEAARVLQSIATASGLMPTGNEQVSFLALGATRRLMVVSRDPAIQSMVRRWIEQVDMPSGEMVRQRYFYRIQHFAPTELVRLLREFLAGDIEDDARNPLDTKMRLTVSNEEDLMLVLATPSDYADLLALLQRIDRPRQQVFLQSVIAEVSLSDNFAFGVEYFLQSTLGSVDLELLGGSAITGSPTGSAFFIGTDGFALLEALNRETDVQLLSAPSIFVQNKGEATIQVGGETPILTSARETGTQTDGSTDVRNEIEYRPTGVTLTVQPRISESGAVTIKLKQEITDAVQNISSAIGSPEFTTRMVETTVTVPHGRTLVLGGIISNDRTNSVSRIPVLGELPLLGHAFRSTQKDHSRRELLLAITPTIVADPNDVTIVTSRFLQAVGAVEDALRSLQFPLPGMDIPLGPPEENGRPLGADPAASPAPPPAPARPALTARGLDLLADDVWPTDDPRDQEVQLFLHQLASIMMRREAP